MIAPRSANLKAFFLLQFTKEAILSLAPKGIPQQKKPLLVLPPQRPLPTKKPLKVPETKVPVHLQYIKKRKKLPEIDFGKIDGLIFDPLVKEIECNGPDELIIVRGNMGTKEVNIALTREEIDDLVREFSDASKIPVHEGLFKVFVDGFDFSAIVSEITGSKFIIKKSNYNPSFRLK